MGVLSGTLRPMAFKNVKKPLFSAVFRRFLWDGCVIKTMKSHIALLAFCLICLSAAAEQSVLDKFVAPNDVTWSTLGTSENDSMPIGNGDIAVNVWTEQNGDLVLLVAKSDAWSEIGKLVKLGRVRIHLTPNPFAGAADF